MSFIASVEDALADAAVHHNRIALLYSGGLESSLLLHLAEAWQDRTTVYIVRTGTEFPHMVAHTDRALDGWDHRIIESDVVASFRERGIPANAVPIEHAPAFAPVFGRRLLPAIVEWPMCCAENRNFPGYRAIVGDGMPVAFHGQRAGDFRGKRPPPAFEGIKLIAPLWEVTRDEVWDAVRDLGVIIPDHYDEFASSLDCSICPASLTPARRAWMTKHYPKQLQMAEALQAAVTKAVVEALNGEGTYHAHDPK